MKFPLLSPDFSPLPVPRGGWPPPLRRAMLLALLGTGLVLAGLPRAGAQDFAVLTTLHTFDPNNLAGGDDPSSGLLQGPDGSFYGLTAVTVFRITPTGVLTTLHSFVSTDGVGPTGTLVLGRDGSFYGTAAGQVLSGGLSGGPSETISYGSVFRVTPAGVFTVLHLFSGTDGLGATGLTLGKDGNFYGVGGLGIFRITPAGVLTNLYAADPAAAEMINSPLVLGDDGNFYGTTEDGGTDAAGTVFRITPAGVLTTLYTFKNGSNGTTPRGGLTLGSDGDFYGVAGNGGSGGQGTVFKVTRAGHLTTLHSFTGGADGGALPGRAGAGQQRQFLRHDLLRRPG